MVNYGGYFDGFISNTQGTNINMPHLGVFMNRVKQISVLPFEKQRAEWGREWFP